ncbi:MAG: CAP domain-containing protein [Actinobacteria bacterium]|nr:CAP domain-containing protein [Actinomycetota bacterium]
MRRGLVKTVKVFGLTLALSVVLAAVAPSAHATWTPRLDMLGWMNSARSTRGAVSLDPGWRLRKMANEHSKQMAYAGRIFHTASLGTKLTFVSWSVAGENVGAGGSMRGLFDAFMKSDAHRDNILGRGFRRAGVGLYVHDGFLWVTLIFVG